MEPLIFFNSTQTANEPEVEGIVDILQKCCRDENKKLVELTYVFMSDDELLEMNRKHLGHDYYTDIITFDYSEEESLIEGECYISLDRTKENATTYGVSFRNELFRVIIHGLLHLIGYADKDEASRTEMRNRENFYLEKEGSTWNK